MTKTRKHEDGNIAIRIKGGYEIKRSDGSVRYASFLPFDFRECTPSEPTSDQQEKAKEDDGKDIDVHSIKNSNNKEYDWIDQAYVSYEFNNTGRISNMGKVFRDVILMHMPKEDKTTVSLGTPTAGTILTISGKKYQAMTSWYPVDCEDSGSITITSDTLSFDEGYQKGYTAAKEERKPIITRQQIKDHFAKDYPRLWAINPTSLDIDEMSIASYVYYFLRDVLGYTFDDETEEETLSEGTPTMQKIKEVALIKGDDLTIKIDDLQRIVEEPTMQKNSLTKEVIDSIVAMAAENIGADVYGKPSFDKEYFRETLYSIYGAGDIIIDEKGFISDAKPKEKVGETGEETTITKEKFEEGEKIEASMNAVDWFISYYVGTIPIIRYTKYVCINENRKDYRFWNHIRKLPQEGDEHKPLV